MKKNVGGLSTSFRITKAYTRPLATRSGEIMKELGCLRVLTWTEKVSPARFWTKRSTDFAVPW